MDIRREQAVVPLKCVSIHPLTFKSLCPFLWMSHWQKDFPEDTQAVFQYSVSAPFCQHLRGHMVTSDMRGNDANLLWKETEHILFLLFRAEVGAKRELITVLHRRYGMLIFLSKIVNVQRKISVGNSGEWQFDKNIKKENSCSSQINWEIYFKILVSIVAEDVLKYGGSEWKQLKVSFFWCIISLFLYSFTSPM